MAKPLSRKATNLFLIAESILNLAALPLGLLAEILVYGRSYWLPRFRKEGPRG